MDNPETSQPRTAIRFKRLLAYRIVEVFRYVCRYIFMYVCLCLCMFVCMHVCTHVCPHVFMFSSHGILAEFLPRGSTFSISSGLVSQVMDFWPPGFTFSINVGFVSQVMELLPSRMWAKIVARAWAIGMMAFGLVCLLACWPIGF